MTSRRTLVRARGSGLIVVLWIIGILSLMVGSFAFDAHIEARITSYYRKRTKASYLAKSGVEIARMLMDGSSEMARDQEKTAEDEEDAWYGQKLKLAEGLAIRGLTYELGEGAITLDIVPEPARRNVNLINDPKHLDDWERILEVGGIPEELWPELTDSFFDWVDKDDEPRLNGAESEDYYETLPDPYRANNSGAIETVEELLLVKGFTRTILFGGALELELVDEPIYVSGIGDLWTTYGDGKVNVNAATDRVLMTLPGVDELVARAILQEREGWVDETGETEDASFRDVNDFLSRIPGLEAGIGRYISTDSKIYRITSVGTVHGVAREIWCIVRHAGKQMTILRWREEE